MKVSKSSIDRFLDSKSFLFYGISNDRNKFGNSVFKHLLENSYNVIPVHTEIQQMYKADCIKDINNLQNKPEAAIIILSPNNTDKVLKELISYGIKRVWVQQRCESEESENLCSANDIECITGECIMMFARNIGIVHKVHKLINKITKRLPV